MKFIFIIILIFTLASCESFYLLKSNKKSAKFDVKSNKLFVNGTLGRKAFFKAKNTIENNPQIKYLILENIEGSVNQYYSRLLCDYVKKKQLQTIAPPKSQIYGDGVDLLFSGKKPIISDSSFIGVSGENHKKKNINKFDKKNKIHRHHTMFYDSLQINLDYYWYKISKANNELIYWMPYEDIEKMKLGSVVKSKKIENFLTEKVNFILLVGLNSYETRYNILLKHREITNAEELKKSVINKNKETKKAFDSLYTTTPFYFFSLANLDKIINGDYGSVYDSSYKANIIKKEKNIIYLIADVSSTDNLNLPSLNLRFENYKSTNKYQRTLDSFGRLKPNFYTIVKKFNNNVSSFIAKIKGY